MDFPWYLVEVLGLIWLHLKELRKLSFNGIFLWIKRTLCVTLMHFFIFVWGGIRRWAFFRCFFAKFGYSWSCWIGVGTKGDLWGLWNSYLVNKEGSRLQKWGSFVQSTCTIYALHDQVTWFFDYSTAKLFCIAEMHNIENVQRSCNVYAAHGPQKIIIHSRFFVRNFS